MKKILGMGLLAALLLLQFSGCASRKEVVQFKNDMIYVKNQLDAMRSENDEIKAMIREMNQKVTALQDETQQNRADILAEISDIREKTQYLDNKLQDNISQMSKYLYKPQSSTSGRGTTDSTAADSLQSGGGENPGAYRSAGEVNPQELYNTAFLDISKGNYQLALEGFREYLKRFPESELADNAQYWIGEAFYAQGHYHAAFDEFKVVVSKYPQGQKVPASLLKMGYCSLKLGDRLGARKYLEMVTERFPNSEEAKLAKSKIANELNGN